MVSYNKLLKNKVGNYEDYPGMDPHQFKKVALRACPFCSGKAKMKEKTIGTEKRVPTISVQCTRCGVEPFFYLKKDVTAEQLQSLWNGVEYEEVNPVLF